jgi:site-specific DNA-methyltransferase (adenine-specific)
VSVYEGHGVTLHHADCLDVLRSLPDCSVDAVICDPPYGLANTDPAHVVEALTRWSQGDRDFIPSGRGFMGKEWDAFVPPPAVWDECARILKPGGHLLAFAGSRTFDLMALSIRFAGFEIRDSIAWLYGSGFPKSLDVSKAIDKAQGATGTYG